jgi:hypothetical protein
MRTRVFTAVMLCWALSAHNAATRTIEFEWLPRTDDENRSRAVRSIPTTFVAPNSFAGMEWGSRLAEIPEVAPLLRLNFAVFQSDRRQKQVYQLRCPGSSRENRYSCIEPDSIQLRTPLPDLVYSEAFVDYQLPNHSYRERFTNALFDEASYLFCSVYLGLKQTEHLTKDMPSVRQDLQFCGVRLKFRSWVPADEAGSGPRPESTNAELAALAPPAAELPGPEMPLIGNNGGRVLTSLRYAFGEPFEVKQPPEQETEDQRHRMQRVLHYTWCPTDAPHYYAIHCTAQVVYVRDALTGNGLVFVATPAVYAYLYSRIIDRHQGSKLNRRDWYYLLMLPDPPLEYPENSPVISEEFDPARSLNTADMHALFELPKAASSVALAAETATHLQHQATATTLSMKTSLTDAHATNMP